MDSSLHCPVSPSFTTATRWPSPVRSDPDSRRVFPAEGTLTSEQQKTLALVRRVGSLRRCHPALRRGNRILLASGNGTYAFMRDAGDASPALALFSKNDVARNLPLPSGIVPPGEYLDVLTSEVFSLVGEASVAMNPLSLRILIRSQHPCR